MPQFDLEIGDNSTCQHDGCSKLATKVCHHPECKVQDNMNPLILCDACDMELHSTQHFNGHLRLDVRPHGTSLGRSVSTRSCPASGPLSDVENTETVKGDDDDNDKQNDEIDGPISDAKEKISKRASKLQRKKAYRRHHTDVTRSSKTLETVHGNDSDEASAETHNADKLPRKSSITKNQSREWFSLKFDMMGKDDIEIVAAIKGRSLREALEGIFSVRKLDLDSVNIFLDQSNTPLPLQFETYPLGGHSLIVKAKDPVKDGEDFRRSHIYNVSSRTRIKEKEKEKEKDKLKGSQRGLKNIISLFGETMSPLNQSGYPGNTPSSADYRRPRLSDVFVNKEKEKLQSLSEKLESYSINGIPDMPDLLTFHRHKEDSDGNLYALGAWTDVVDGVETMTKKERDQQEAIWEILVTEVKYINKLKVIMEVFFSTLLNLQEEWLLNEIDSEKLFSNLQNLLDVHETFWRENLVKIVQKGRQTREPLSPELVAEAFRNFEKRFGGYVKYCIEEYSCVIYMKAQMKENELFKVYVEWAENQKRCNRMKLGDLLVGPMQRLTKYPLLLKAVASKTEPSQAKDALSTAIKDVEKFIFKINRALRLRHERKKLEAIQSKVENYDVIESTNEELSKLVDEYIHFNLCAPMPGVNPTEQRLLLHDGAIRLKDQEGKIDILAFLFTDMLLITKQTKKGDKIKIVKPAMRIDRIVTRELKDGSGFSLVYLDDYGLALWAYSLQVAGGADQTRVWLQNIYKAKHLYREAVKRHRVANALRMTSDNHETSEDEHGKISPRSQIQVPEVRISRRRSSGSVASSGSPAYQSRRGNTEKSNFLDISEDSGKVWDGVSRDKSKTVPDGSQVVIQRRTPVQLTRGSRPASINIPIATLPTSPDSSQPSSTENSPRLPSKGSVFSNMTGFLRLSRSVSDRATGKDAGERKASKKSIIKKRMSWGPSTREAENLLEQSRRPDRKRESMSRILEHKAVSLMDISHLESADNSVKLENGINHSVSMESLPHDRVDSWMSSPARSKSASPRKQSTTDADKHGSPMNGLKVSPRRYASETAIPDRVQTSDGFTRSSQSVSDLAGEENDVGQVRSNSSVRSDDSERGSHVFEEERSGDIKELRSRDKEETQSDESKQVGLCDIQERSDATEPELKSDNSPDSLPKTPDNTPVGFLCQDDGMKDGIKSVKVKEYGKKGSRRKMKHSEIVRLRKNLILTATTTASEV